MNANKGFTLIELVVVIVILGVLAITAAPRFLDLTQEAEVGAVQGVAGAVSSAAAINYAACKADSTSTDCSTVDTCSAAGALLQGGALPTGYVFDAPTTAVAPDATVDCQINSPNGADATATVIGTP